MPNAKCHTAFVGVVVVVVVVPAHHHVTCRSRYGIGIVGTSRNRSNASAGSAASSTGPSPEMAPIDNNGEGVVSLSLGIQELSGLNARDIGPVTDTAATMRSPAREIAGTALRGPLDIQTEKEFKKALLDRLYVCQNKKTKKQETKIQKNKTTKIQLGAVFARAYCDVVAAVAVNANTNANAAVDAHVSTLSLHSHFEYQWNRRPTIQSLVF